MLDHVVKHKKTYKVIQNIWKQTGCVRYIFANVFLV